MLFSSSREQIWTLSIGEGKDFAHLQMGIIRLENADISKSWISWKMFYMKNKMTPTMITRILETHLLIQISNKKLTVFRFLRFGYGNWDIIDISSWAFGFFLNWENW